MPVDVFDETGCPVRDEPGELVCTVPFPSMPVGFWNDPDGAKYHAAYFGAFVRDPDGNNVEAVCHSPE